MRRAALVGGLATGALLLTGTGAQAADVDQAAAHTAPELLGGLPVPGLGGPHTPAAGDLADMTADVQPPAPSGAVDDLLGNLGGGLPVPLPF
ncbi:hypothetical protein GCM10027447_04870 [Glycomyces halotolerans]